MLLKRFFKMMVICVLGFVLMVSAPKTSEALGKLVEALGGQAADSRLNSRIYWSSVKGRSSESKHHNEGDLLWWRGGEVDWPKQSWQGKWFLGNWFKGKAAFPQGGIFGAFDKSTNNIGRMMFGASLDLLVGFGIDKGLKSFKAIGVGTKTITGATAASAYTWGGRLNSAVSMGVGIGNHASVGYWVNKAIPTGSNPLSICQVEYYDEKLGKALGLEPYRQEDKATFRRVIVGVIEKKPVDGKNCTFVTADGDRILFTDNYNVLTKSWDMLKAATPAVEWRKIEDFDKDLAVVGGNYDSRNNKNEGGHTYVCNRGTYLPTRESLHRGKKKR